jgi:hypothetical protein
MQIFLDDALPELCTIGWRAFFASSSDRVSPGNAAGENLFSHTRSDSIVGRNDNHRSITATQNLHDSRTCSYPAAYPYVPRGGTPAADDSQHAAESKSYACTPV